MVMVQAVSVSTLKCETGSRMLAHVYKHTSNVCIFNINLLHSYACSLSKCMLCPANFHSATFLSNKAILQGIFSNAMVWYSQMFLYFQRIFVFHLRCSYYMPGAPKWGGGRNPS